MRNGYRRAGWSVRSRKSCAAGRRIDPFTPYTKQREHLQNFVDLRKVNAMYRIEDVGKRAATRAAPLSRSAKRRLQRLSFNLKIISQLVVIVSFYDVTLNLERPVS